VAIVGTNFPTPKPSLTDFQASITAAQDAIVEADGKVNDARAAVAARRMAVDALLANVRLLAAYVESESGGETDKILSSGFDVRAASNGQARWCRKSDAGWRASPCIPEKMLGERCINRNQ
jgi:hypothetical protein